MAKKTTAKKTTTNKGKGLSKEEKLEKMKGIVKGINKGIKGRNPIKCGGELEVKEKLPTGIPVLDKAIGGGPQKGNFTVVYGPKGSGKTTYCLHAIAKTQKNGGVCLFIDAEHKYDVVRAEQMGVNNDELFFLDDIENAETMMDMIREMLDSGCLDLIVLDSLQALSPEGENVTKKGVTKSVSQDTMALLARKLSQFCRMIANDVAQNKIAFILIGQARMDLGGFIASLKLSGGNAILHWSVIIMKFYGLKEKAVRKFKVMNEETGRLNTVGEPVGFNVNVGIDKMHVSGGLPEGTTFKLPYYYDTGFIEPDWVETDRLVAEGKMDVDGNMLEVEDEEVTVEAVKELTDKQEKEAIKEIDEKVEEIIEEVLTTD